MMHMQFLRIMFLHCSTYRFKVAANEMHYLEVARKEMPWRYIARRIRYFSLFFAEGTDIR